MADEPTVGGVAAVRRGVAITAALLALLLLSASGARGAGPWEGFWEVYSVGEDAYMSLRQEGDRVVGTYFPYNGRLEGVAENGVLRGRWQSPNGSGTFAFALTTDGQGFSGAIGSGEWWNGRRIDEEDIGSLSIDLMNPGLAVRSFLTSGRAYRDGEISGLQAMFSTLHFTDDPPFAEKSRRARLLYDVLSQTTFRLFELRPDAAAPGEKSPDHYTYEFRQAGTGEEVTVHFRRDVFELWRIEAPQADRLEADRQRLLEARGRRELDPTGYRALASPRHTLEAFIAGMRRWDIDGRDMVRSTIDFSAVSEKLRDWRLPVVATFLASSLNRSGRLVMEEIPDDPERRRPYLLYKHAAGDIVLTRREDEQGAHRWQFSVATVANAKALHDALRTVPVVHDNVPTPRIDTPYFRARALAFRIHPGLTGEHFGIELWQWLGLLLLTIVLPLLAHRALRRIEKGIDAAAELEHGPDVATYKRYAGLARLFAVGGLWVLGATGLGLPDRFSGPLYAAGWVLIIVGVTWQLYRVIDAVSGVLQEMAKHTRSTADDVAVTLLSGLARILLLLGALIAVADVLGMPYETVLAGIGVSGLALAIASRDLLANLFGSVVIASDRPFKKGDFVSVGSIMGTVEKVGLRSTRLRPVDDTSVTIPNSAISTDRVVNLSRRRRIRVLETIHVSHDVGVDAILDIRERLRGQLLDDPMVFEENVRVGLTTVSLYAVEMEIAFYITTTNYDEFLYEKHRIMAQLLATLEAAGVQRAVIRRD